tara:strand:- start:11780 stop:13435 length:1656 start_codon:yes stop_codon:yes gene_type:complete
MLENLIIKNYVIVDQLNLNFSEGFSVLTGETGAGKSILIDALSLALGQRSESGVVRQNSDKADISASFDISNNHCAQEWLSKNEFDSEENELILRRVIYVDGKSKAFINGIPVNIAQVKILGEYLVDIYSQNSHHSLLKLSAQRDILDSFSGHNKEVMETNLSFKAWQKLYSENEEFEKNKENYIEELKELQEKNSEFLRLDFSSSGWEKLQEDHKVLASGNDLREGIKECLSHLESDDNSLNKTMSKLLAKFKGLLVIDRSLETQKKIIDSLEIDLSELSRELNNYLHSLETNEGLQDEIEIKIQSVFDFCRKYHIKPNELEEQSLEWHHRLEKLNLLLSEEGISLAAKEAKIKYDQCAKKLTANRKKTATSLSKIITVKLNQLSFKDAKFLVGLKPIQASINGNEQIEFLISTHTNADPKPIQKVASGGELSRISLAIRVASISEADVPSMIFDEVDVGIGGGVAEVVGKLLQNLGNGKNRQIFVITHLPQVAAQAGQHYKVTKKIINNETVSAIQLLDETKRIEEIARMLGGIKITEATIDHAKEILS